MYWINLFLKLTAWVPGLFFSIENWRIWYWNRYKRGDEAPIPYYPVVGSLFLFFALSRNLPAEYGYAAYLALIMDFGCLPLGVLCLYRSIFRKHFGQK